MARQKWIEKRLNISLSKTEVDLLETYCTENEREYTDVIRELVRTLKVNKAV